MNIITPGQNIAGLARPSAFLQNRRLEGTGDGHLKGSGNGYGYGYGGRSKPLP